MRQIEKEMLSAIEEGRNWTKDNTYVNPVIGGIEVWLFNNHIATIDGDEVKVNKATLASYPTSTTRSRLRALGVDVYQKTGRVYIGDELIIDTNN